MKLYQLGAKGKFHTFQDSGKIYSRQVWKREPTQEEKDAFIQKCTRTDSLFDLDPDDITLVVLELELVED